MIVIFFFYFESLLYLAAFLFVMTKHLIRNNTRKVLVLLAVRSGNRRMKQLVMLSQTSAHGMVSPTLRVFS